MNTHYANTITKPSVCLYGTQGTVSCEKSIWIDCENSPVKSCNNKTSTCSDVKCKPANDLLFARFQDETNTWR